MMVWELLVSNTDAKNLRTQRARVPGGWLVLVTYHSNAFVNYVPDPSHQWNPDDEAWSQVGPSQAPALD